VLRWALGAVSFGALGAGSSSVYVDGRDPAGVSPPLPPARDNDDDDDHHHQQHGQHPWLAFLSLAMETRAEEGLWYAVGAALTRRRLGVTGVVQRQRQTWKPSTATTSTATGISIGTTAPMAAGAAAAGGEEGYCSASIGAGGNDATGIGPVTPLAGLVATASFQEEVRACGGIDTSGRRDPGALCR
jgi:hypothetical protein